MRVITINENKKIVGVKYVGVNYNLTTNDIESDIGEIGQIQQKDGSFIDDSEEPIEQLSSSEEVQAKILLNTEYLVIMSEVSAI